MKCLFCEKEATLYKYMENYWKCFDCQVNYDLRDNTVVFYIIGKIGHYSLVLNYELHRSQLFFLQFQEDGYPYQEPTILITINYIMPNITPQNIQNKIQTLLLFS